MYGYNLVPVVTVAVVVVVVAARSNATFRIFPNETSLIGGFNLQPFQNNTYQLKSTSRVALEMCDWLKRGHKNSAMENLPVRHDLFPKHVRFPLPHGVPNALIQKPVMSRYETWLFSAMPQC